MKITHLRPRRQQRCAVGEGNRKGALAGGVSLVCFPI